MNMKTDPRVSQIGADMAIQFMLITLFRMVAEMSENPSELLGDVRVALYDLAATYTLRPMPAAEEQAIREAAKAVITGVMANAGAPQPH
jgi:hypothetical protein